MLEADGSRVLLDCGPGVLGRLREAETWPSVDAIAITHLHLDHWGDLVPWVWGTLLSRLERPGAEARALGAARGRRVPRRARRAPRLPGHVRARRSSSREYDAGHAVLGSGSSTVTPTRVPHYTLETYAFRVQANGARAHVLGRLGAVRRARGGRPRRRPLRLRGDAPPRRARRRAARPPLARRGRRRSSSRPGQGACSSRTARASYPTPEGYELAYDGLELDV